MRKPNPKKYLVHTAPITATVVLGAICLFDAPRLEAQAPAVARASIVSQFPPKLGEVESKLTYKPSHKPSPPALKRINSIERSIVKIQTDPKPERLPYDVIPEIEFQRKRPVTTLPTLRKNTTPTFQNLPVENPPQVAEKQIENADQFVKSITNRQASASETSQATANRVPPTVVLRPSVLVSNHENECVFEINEIESSNDVSLKVAIPDSVTMIEVIPNRNSKALRKFRIKMEQGNETNETQRTEETKETELVNRPPQERVAQNDPPQPQPERPEPEPLQPQPPQPMTAQAMPPKPADSLNHTSRQGYLRNPFFKENKVETTVEKVAQIASPENVQEQSSSEKPKLKENNKHVTVRHFLKRISHTSSSKETEQLATQALAFEPEEQTLKHAHSFAAPTPVIAAQIVGPTEIDVSQTADFMIGIVNPMNVTNRDLEIELDVPSGFKIVLLDQAAEFNERTGILHWKVKEIKPGGRARLRYRVMSLRSGQQLQRVAVRIKDDLVDRHEIRTLAKLNLNAGAGELPYDGDLSESLPLDPLSSQSDSENLDVDASELPIDDDLTEPLPLDLIGSQSKPTNVDIGANEFPFKK